MKKQIKVAEKMITAFAALGEAGFFSGNTSDTIDALFFLHNSILQVVTVDYEHYMHIWESYDKYVRSFDEKKYNTVKEKAVEMLKSYGITTNEPKQGLVR